MKKIIALTLILLVSCTCIYAKKTRTIKVAVEPAEAQISADGLYIGEGIATFSISKDDGFVVVKAELAGYKPVTTKFYFNDKRDAISFKLRKDATEDYLTTTDLANKYFTINVSPQFYEMKDGKIDATKAWRAVQSVILNYFDEIQTSDLTTGFFQTPWEYTKIPELDYVIRTRVTVKENNQSDRLIFQVKVSSERSQSTARREGWTEIPYLVKKFQPMIEELQSRLQSK